MGVARVLASWGWHMPNVPHSPNTSTKCLCTPASQELSVFREFHSQYRYKLKAKTSQLSPPKPTTKVKEIPVPRAPDSLPTHPCSVGQSSDCLTEPTFSDWVAIRVFFLEQDELRRVDVSSKFVFWFPLPPPTFDHRRLLQQLQFRQHRRVQ